MDFIKFKTYFLNILSSTNLDIQHHALNEDEISDLYINDVYIEGEEEKFSQYLYKEFEVFKRKVVDEIYNVSDSAVFLKMLRKEISNVKEDLRNRRHEEMRKLYHYKITVPPNKINFVSDIRDLQTLFLTKAEDYISELLTEIESPEFHKGSEFKLKFNLTKKETILLLIILEETNILENIISNNKTKAFIEKYFQYKHVEGNAIVYRNIESISSLLPKFKNGEAPYKESIDYIKELISTASLEKRFNASD